MSDRIVIAVGGRETERPAIDWGAAYAAARGLRVELVHVVDTTWAYDAPLLIERALSEAELRIAGETQRLKEANPGLVVSGEALLGNPSQVIVDRSADAHLLVLGTHRAGGTGSGKLCSRRAARIAERAVGTVVVVPPESTPDGGTGVVAGVDGSELSIKALRFAADIADRAGEPLTAVHAWLTPWPWGVAEALPGEEPSEDEELLLSESLAGLAEDFPGLRIARSLPHELPTIALNAAAEGARLLAVGSHGRGALGRMWFGSTSMDLLLTMPCPVAIVR